MIIPPLLALWSVAFSGVMATLSYEELLNEDGLDTPRDQTGASSSQPARRVVSIANYASMRTEKTRLNAIVAAAASKRYSGSTSSASSSPATSPRVYEGVPVAPGQKVFAIGDIHGDYDAFVQTLITLGLIDENYWWTGGNSILVQTGDIVDRGPDAKHVWEFIDTLRPEVKKAGGEIVTLLGNHEVMNVMGFLRDVSEDDTKLFGTAENRAYQFSKLGSIGQLLRAMKTTEKVGDTVFVHGGINSQFSRFGIVEINRRVREILNSENPQDSYQDPLVSTNGPLWERLYGNFKNRETFVCADLTESLRNLNAKRMVIGHTVTPQRKVHTRCGGRLVMIDIAISKYMSATANVGGIEIADGVVTAITPKGRSPPLDLVFDDFEWKDKL